MAAQRRDEPARRARRRASSAASAGAAGRFSVNGEAVTTQARITLQPGDVVRLDLPGGGGYGAAGELDPAQQLSVEGDDDRREAHQDRPDGGRQRESGPGEHAGCQRDGDDVVAGGPGEVLHHLAIARPREPDDPGDAAWIAGGEDDPGGLDGHVGAGTDGDADVGAGERRARR